jgi:ABC-type uncharacterized transport system ATPase subunit
MAPGCEPQRVLHALAARATITTFAIVKPSLHDIFLRIAGPQLGPQQEEKKPDA